MKARARLVPTVNADMATGGIIHKGRRLLTILSDPTVLQPRAPRDGWYDAMDEPRTPPFRSVLVQRTVDRRRNRIVTR